MSVTTVSFQHTTLPSETYLTELENDGPPFTVHGVALGPGDVTKGASGIKKKWPAQELEQAADSLADTNLVVDHENSADGVVGRVQKAGFKEGTGVVYQAELYDEDLAEKIENGLLEVSIRGYHADVDNLEEDDDTGALIVEDIVFDNLSIVPTGAAPSNTLNMGAHEELSKAQLEQFTAELLDEAEPGMFVEGEDMHGVTVAQPENGEIEVDIYEEQDGQWRSTEETTMVSVDELDEWDVEESDIGPVMKDDSDNSEEAEVNPPEWDEGDMVQWQVNPDMKGRVVHNPDDRDYVMVEIMDDGEPTGYTLTAGYTDLERATGIEMKSDMSIPMPEDAQLLYPDKDKAQQAADKMGLDGTHEHEFEGESWYMPGEDHDSFAKVMDELEADPKYSQGDWVNWDTRNSTEIGTVFGSYTEGDDVPDFRGSRNMSPEGDEVLYALRMYKERDGTYHPIEGKPIGHYEDSLRSAQEPSDVSESPVELDQHETRPNYDDVPAYKKNDWVRIQFSPEVLARVAYIHRERETLELEIFDVVNGELKDTGQSAEVGYSSVYRIDSSDVDGVDMLPDQEEMGRSNAENYTDFSEGDWVQWYPNESSERHGKVTSVDTEAEEITVQSWVQNSDGEWAEGDETLTKAVDDPIEPWGNFPRDMGDFADGEDPRKKPADNDYSEEENTSAELISDQTETALRNKVEEHNEKHAEDDESKRVTYRMLKNVYKRGAGAYNDTHREGMTQQQWAMARVNAFLYLVRNGNPENDAYKQDNDLLPEGHPKYDENPPDAEENALTTADVIAETVFGEHDPMGSDDEQTVQEIVERVETAELESSMDELDEVYSEWSDTVNMTASELQSWSENPCSREASRDPVSVMKRNLGLLKTNKEDWDTGDIDDAKRTISFINRMRGTDTADKTGGSFGCPSKRDISLLNWAYNPFDEVPSTPDTDELDSVDRVTLAADEGETQDGDTSDVATLIDYDMHEVSFDDTHESEWDRPRLMDFVEAMDISEDISEYDDLTQGDQESVASAFIISASGFPAENFGDLKLPVVEPTGELSLNALAAVKGGRGASEVDGLTDSMEDEIMDYVNQLAQDEFDKDWSENETMAYHSDEDTDDSEMMDVPESHMFESRSDAEEKAEDMGISGAHEMDGMFVPGSTHDEYMAAVEEMSAPTATVKSVGSMTTNKVTIMQDNIEEKLNELSEPVAVEAEELDDLQTKADRFDEMTESLEELRERTAILDEVDQDALEELKETEDAVVVPAAQYEELQDEAEQVTQVYAASLAEEIEIFDADELAERYSIDELREKFEAEFGSVEEELTATGGSNEAEPRSQDPSEEQLEEEAGNGSEEELADEIAEKQQAIRQKILSN